LKKIDVVHILLANKAPVNARDAEEVRPEPSDHFIWLTLIVQLTPLHLAAAENNLDLVTILLRSGADVNARTVRNPAANGVLNLTLAHYLLGLN